MNKWAHNTGEMVVTGENRKIQMQHLSNFPLYPLQNPHEMAWVRIEITGC
jgi:hypothetical protein